MSELLRPSVLAGSYPERSAAPSRRLDRLCRRLGGRRRHRHPTPRDLERFAEQVVRRSEGLRSSSQADLQKRVAGLRPHLRKRLAGVPLLETLAIIREQSRRHLGMSHFEVQIMAGCALLRGMLVELDTGEGKTLSGTIPAAAAALAGIPVHVVTVNDYLVERDAEQLNPLFRSLGLTVGTVVDRDPDPEVRRRAYASDITYVTNKQIAFDYLRDRLSRRASHEQIRGEVEQLGNHTSGLLLRGLCFAILDEADSVLIDEARTPLILSKSVPAPGIEEIASKALEVASKLDEKTHFHIRGRGDQFELNREGIEAVEEFSCELGGVWNAPSRRAELVRVALLALHRYQRDEHYIVRDGKIEMVDPQTGRSMPDRSWEGGLQQMIELKEGCELSGERETIARISYQQFFGRYLRLSGMTGTGSEVRREIERIYDMPMIRIPPRKRSKRRDLGVHVATTLPQKWRGVVARIEALHREGRPVLVGTGTVKTSESLSARLAERDLPHRVLNARQDQDEARIIEEAGTSGRITIATAMAGRGSDIRVDEKVEKLGGLHVLSVERAESRRVDRQLYGRCGRQGDAGSFEQIVSLEDDLVEREAEGLLGLMARALRRGTLGSRVLRRWFFRLLQKRVEARHARDRSRMLRLQEELDRLLSFTGASE
ncbi:MAG: prepilin peptidase [Myxococcales bacterium]|nr:prepilin peptidase [Myxococcales bacterium]